MSLYYGRWKYDIPYAIIATLVVLGTRDVLLNFAIYKKKRKKKIHSAPSMCLTMKSTVKLVDVGEIKVPNFEFYQIQQ